jgi:hypothetical protein
MLELMKCCLIKTRFLPHELREVILWRWNSFDGQWQDGPKIYTESESYALVRLANGEYGVLTESEDYTGHG